MTRAERLDEILKNYSNADYWHEGYGEPKPVIKEYREKLITLFMECVPEIDKTVSDFSSYEDDAANHYGIGRGWNFCRAETLRNLEELRK